MTDLEQRKIIVLRSEGKSYNAIAGEMNLSVNTVKTFCRRNRLGGTRGIEKESEKAPEIDLLSQKNRGNTTDTDKPESLENTGFRLLGGLSKSRLHLPRARTSRPSLM